MGFLMPVSEAQRRAINKWDAKHEVLRFRVPLGQREVIRQHAANRGESINAFLVRAVKEAIERDLKESKS